MKQITPESLLAIYISQARCTSLWIGIWDKQKDIGAAKNALTALGKLSGQYGMLLVVYGDENLPEAVVELNTKHSQKWDEIMSHEFHINYSEA
jgi:hypothetical protein